MSGCEGEFCAKLEAAGLTSHAEEVKRWIESGEAITAIHRLAIPKTPTGAKRPADVTPERRYGDEKIATGQVEDAPIKGP